MLSIYYALWQGKRWQLWLRLTILQIRHLGFRPPLPQCLLTSGQCGLRCLRVSTFTHRQCDEESEFAYEMRICWLMPCFLMPWSIDRLSIDRAGPAFSTWFGSVHRCYAGGVVFTPSRRRLCLRGTVSGVRLRFRAPFSDGFFNIHCPRRLTSSTHSECRGRSALSLALGYKAKTQTIKNWLKTCLGIDNLQPSFQWGWSLPFSATPEVRRAQSASQ
jgi:hypothetical protein